MAELLLAGVLVDQFLGASSFLVHVAEAVLCQGLLADEVVLGGIEDVAEVLLRDLHWCYFFARTEAELFGSVRILALIIDGVFNLFSYI